MAVSLWRYMRKMFLAAFIFLSGFLVGAFFVIGQVRALAADSGKKVMPGGIVYASDTGTPENETGAAEIYEYLLVNAWNPLDGRYTPSLVTVESGYEMDALAAQALKTMLVDGRAAGYQLKICSAYRSMEKQTSLFEKKVSQYTALGMGRTEAEAEAAKTVARPGTSEHHTGFAVDLVSEGYQILDEKQENTAEQQWLMANCSRYGFILRYPNSKTDITGIIYEPWHYRYVGVDAAKEIMDRGICLEEYLEEKYPGGENTL